MLCPDPRVATLRFSDSSEILQNIHNPFEKAGEIKDKGKEVVRTYNGGIQIGFVEKSENQRIKRGRCRLCN
jgi:hypothetical protein